LTSVLGEIDQAIALALALPDEEAFAGQIQVPKHAVVHGFGLLGQFTDKAVSPNKTGVS